MSAARHTPGRPVRVQWWEEVVGKGKKTATKGDFVRCFTCIWQILTGQSKDSLKAQNIAEVRRRAAVCMRRHTPPPPSH